MNDEMKKLLMLMEDADKEKQDKEDLSRASISGTADEHEVLTYIRKHYPEAPNTQAAFIKFVIHSLEHSKEDSEKQQRHIEELERKVEQLANMIDQMSQTGEEPEF